MRAPRMDVEGGLLEISADGLIGWARIAGRPDEMARVVIAVNGEPLASAVADRFDIEAVRRQVGPGVAGFVLRLPRAPAGPGPYAITARSAQGNPLGTALTVMSAEALASCLPGSRLTTLEGMVDLLAAGRLHGWVWDRASPDRVVGVDILDGDVLLGCANADQMRDDLRQAGKRGGQCGFSFDLPVALLDMRPHTIRVLTTDGGVELPNSPLQFGPIVTAPLVADIARLRQEVEALGRRLGGIDSPDGAFQKTMMRAMADRVCAFAAIQQDLIERRLDRTLSSVDEIAAPAAKPKKGRRRVGF